MSHARNARWTIPRLVVLVLLLGAGLVAFGPALLDALGIGLHNQDQSHVLLSPIIVFWLVWLRRARLRHVRWQPHMLGPTLVLAGAVLHWIAWQNDIHTVWYLSAIIAIVGVFVSVAGTLPLRLFAPAFGALAFLIPAPGIVREWISLPLQSVATTVTQGSLELLGVPVARLGHVIFVNGEAVTMTEACNGMRLIFSLTLVVYTFAFSLALKPITRLTLILLSPVLAIAANVARLIPTSVVYGHLSADRALLFHDISGWLMLPLVLVTLALLLRVLQWIDLPVCSYRIARS